jgi:phage major head subunit gpT-like protein
MATTISEQWAELLEPGIRATFEIQRTALAAASRIPALFNVMGSTKAEEHFLALGGFEDWHEYEGAIEYDRHSQGYKTTLTHKEYVQGFSIERKLVDDDQYNVISSRPRGLALSAMRTREKHAASVFNNAFSSSYTGGDAVALCSASHPYSPDNASLQSNTGTTALSYATVVSTREAMRAYVDDRGQIVSVNPDLILIPPELEGTANEIVNTMRGTNTQQPGVADYSASLVQEHGIRYLVWDYLTDANNWFLIDSQLAKMYLLWLDRVGLEFEMDPTSDFRLEARFRGYMRYSYGWSDYRFVYGHNVT